MYAFTNDDTIFIAESNAIKEIASEGSCIIIGRCADYILEGNENLFRIFLFSDEKHKIERAIKYYGLDQKNALKEINKIKNNVCVY